MGPRHSPPPEARCSEPESPGLAASPRSIIVLMVTPPYDRKGALAAPWALLVWAIARVVRVTTTTPSEFSASAYERAQRRRSPWNLILFPLAVLPLGVLWYVTARLLGELYVVRHDMSADDFLPPTFAGILIAIGSLIAWFAPAMIIGNCLAWGVRPARRTFEREASGFPGVTFRSANAGLVRMAMLMTPLGLAIGLLGALLL